MFITEMYPWVPSELFMTPLGPKECMLGTTGQQDTMFCHLIHSLGDFNMGHNYRNHSLLSLQLVLLNNVLYFVNKQDLTFYFITNPNSNLFSSLTRWNI